MALEKAHLVAVVYGSDKDKVPSYFRLYGNISDKLVSITYNNALLILKNGGDQIVGLELDGDTIKGSNGDLSRYTKYINGVLSGTEKIVILGTIGDMGYEVYCPGGKVKSLRTNDVIVLAKAYGIANGKIVEPDSGKTFISAIRGEYLESSKAEAILAGLKQNREKEEATIEAAAEKINAAVASTQSSGNTPQGSQAAKPPERHSRYSHP